ncbi:MAG: [Bacteroidales bacterium]|nr:[FeFe] hydrogenase H-cluster maturation GTPase HydF [Bacteroidales bacterium]
MKGNELKPRIGIFGRRNVGKSALVNYLTGQQVAIVDNTAGTTTDPVRKSMEIGGIGPVVIIDTAGLDDEGPLGQQRVEKSMAALAEVDLALICFTEWGTLEQQVEDWCIAHGTALLRIHTKEDISPRPTIAADRDVLGISVVHNVGHDRLIEAIRKAMPESAYRQAVLLEDIVAEGDTVVLVTPIDSSAPEGRMILPQVQVLRNVLDCHARAVVCQPNELPSTLAMLPQPQLVVTDSQAFQQVAQVVPEEVSLTSFSVVLARQKGLFAEYLKGTRAIGSLSDGDRVLLLESCTHNVTCEDIGRVKLPAALRKATGKRLDCTVIGGQSPLPSNMADYALVVQCGGCVITPQQLKARLLPAIEAGVAVSNYGLALAWCSGIFERATKIFRQ